MGGGSLMGGIFSGVGNEQILAGGGTFPIPPIEKTLRVVIYQIY